MLVSKIEMSRTCETWNSINALLKINFETLLSCINCYAATFNILSNIEYVIRIQKC